MPEYREHLEAVKSSQAEKVASWQEIGDIPPPESIDNRERAKADGGLAFFCEHYFPHAFTLPWSEYHYRAAEKIERAARTGGLFAFAMPRGSGKTTLCEWAAQWAVLNGIIEYVVLVGATEKSAEKRLRNIKTSLQTNPLLAADYPEVLLPIAKLERSVRRAEGQKHHGKHTAIGWKAKQLIMPTVEITEKDWPKEYRGQSTAGGSILEVAGITGEIRGLNHMRENGAIVRPQLAICDDPQTRENARSPQQSNARAEVIAGDIAYLNGPGKPISVVVPCTIVYQGDLAARLLDRSDDDFVEFQGETTAMLESFPSDSAMKLWDKYAEMRRQSYRADGDGTEATEFYIANREAMEEGAKVAWEARFDAGEVSALQHAMNKYYRNESAFMAEYQNEPISKNTDEAEVTSGDIEQKTAPYKRGELPPETEHVTAFIDVQKDCLFWWVAGWKQDFSGHVCDYGVFPEQPRRYFELRDIRKTLSMRYPTAGLEGCILAALRDLVPAMFAKRFVRVSDGANLKIDRMMVDANWGQSTDVVYQFCRETEFPVMPAHGRFVGPASLPMSEYKRKKGDRIGLNWRIPSVHGKRTIRHVIFDTNYWKSFVHSRLATPTGDRGALTLFAGRSDEHRLAADHLTAEFRTKTEGRDREVDVWKMRPDRSDNHWLDCLVGSAVLADMCGARLNDTPKPTEPEDEKPKKKHPSRVEYL